MKILKEEMSINFKIFIWDSFKIRKKINNK